MIDHFGLLAPVYDFFIKPKPPETISALLQIPPSGTVLDVGGGTGRVTQHFAGGEEQIIICDLSYPMLRQSQAKGGLVPICSHSERLPFPDASFDRVLMVDTLHHVCDQAQTAGEMWRVMKPGGRILIEEPNRKHWMVKLVAWGEKLALMRSHFLTPEGIRDLFSGYDCSISLLERDHTAWIIIQKEGLSSDPQLPSIQVQDEPVPERQALYDPEEFVHHSLSGLKDPQSIMALDLGTGSGAIAGATSERGIFTVGVDEPQGALLGSRLERGIPAGIQAQAETLPFAGDTFAITTLGFLLHGVDDPLQILRETKRVTTDRVAILEWPHIQEALGPPLNRRISHQQMQKWAGQLEVADLDVTKLGHMTMYMLHLP